MKTMHGFGVGMGGFGWLAMTLGYLAFLALASAVVYMLAHVVTPQDSARKVLKQRYARGEIDDQEYQQRLRTLGS